jgi:adenosylcobinamide-GDP ribazoletransferase
LNGFLAALGFLTAIPVRSNAADLQALGRAGAWFPVVGLLLGVVLSMAQWALALVFPPLLAAALVVSLWALLTGGLHLDGLADCGDGLLAAAAPARRLEIMRDSRMGAFGGLALGLFLILKVAAAGALPGRALFAAVPPLFGAPPAWLPFGPLVVAAVGARWLILLVARQPAARPGGLGDLFAAGLNARALSIGGVIVLVIAVLGGWWALLAVAAAHIVALLVVRLARARLGGVTGDVLGLTVELAELTVLLVYAVRTG